MLIRLTPNAPVASMVSMANTQTSNQTLTADTITDEQIRMLLDNGLIDRVIANNALRLTGGTFSWEHARAHCAALLNEMSEHYYASRNAEKVAKEDGTLAGDEPIAALRALFREACDIGQRYTRALRAIMPNADRVVADDERLTNIAKEGGI